MCANGQARSPWGRSATDCIFRRECGPLHFMAMKREMTTPHGRSGCRSACCDELILLSTKPLWAPDATDLKPFQNIGYRNDAPERRIWGSQIFKQGDYDVQSRIAPENACPPCRQHYLRFERSRAACARCRFVGQTCRGTYSGSAATSMREAELDECRSYLPVVDRTARQHESRQ